MVTVIACTMRSSYMNNIFHNYLRQTWEQKELIIILNNNDMKIREWQKKAAEYPNIKVHQLPQSYTLGKCLNWGIARAKSDVIAKFDDDDYYGRDYLTESMKVLKEGKAPIVGKTTTFIYFENESALMLYRKGRENQYRPRIKGGTLLFKKSVWDRVRFPENRVAGSDARWLLNCNKAGFRIYSVSRYNYVCVRRRDLNSHTQRKSPKSYMASCRMIRRTTDYRSSVTKRF